MVKVIGVRFRTAGKIYFFDPLNFEIKKGDHVIVETARGIEYGTVMSDPRMVEDDKVVQPLKPVIRVATSRDTEQEESNRQKEKEAFKVCLEKIHAHNLDMKLIDAEYTFDNNKVLFYFTADGRIDFRELVKDLASVFKTRIELRQIGVRDETKLRGGIGICGRPLCCYSYLSDFVPVSIKMAKEQNLSLNPTKISGVCGRLMCCLKNEEDTYEELNRKLPNVGDYVTTEDGLKGEVHSVNVLRQRVKVIVDVNDEKEIKEYDVEQLQFKKKHGRRDKMDLSKEEMIELERLEKEEKQEEREEKERSEEETREVLGENSEGDRHARGGRRREGSEEGGRDNRRDGHRRDGKKDNRRGKEGGQGSDGEGQGAKEGRDNRQNREGRDNRRDNRDNRKDHGQEGRENSKENRQGKNRGDRRGKNRDNRENRENRENKDNRENNDNRENRDERRPESKADSGEQ